METRASSESDEILRGASEPEQRSIPNENTTDEHIQIKTENTGEFETDINNISSLLQVQIDTDPCLLDPKEELDDEPIHTADQLDPSVQAVIKDIVQLGKSTKKNAEKKFTCEICTKAFKSKQQLRVHTVVHNDLKSFGCIECLKSFKLKSQLLNHMKIHSNLKPYVCDICGKPFRLKQQMEVHSRTHSDERPFECYICGKSFKLKSSLLTHELVHSDIKAFNCEVCGKAFKLKQQLQTHQQTHNDLKPFECEICGKSFKMKQQLQNHQKAHSDERPFKCEFCDKSFKFKQRLQVHFKVHFSDSTQLKRRLKSSPKEIDYQSNDDHKSFQEIFLESMSFVNLKF